eukprot:COSAG02_NODE_48649_length_332_cov_0.832618_1_plen_21_part_01
MNSGLRVVVEAKSGLLTPLGG